jgi:hypothetical protein
MARRVSFWSALAHDELPAAARASARTRLADLPLTAEEAAATKATLASLGRAIREARVRASRGPAPVVAPTVEPAAVTSRRRLWLAAGGLAVIVLGWYLLVGSPSGPLADRPKGGAGAANVVAVLPLAQSRGRTALAPLIVAVGASQVPTTSSPPGTQFERPEPGDAGGGPGGAGGAGGSGIISGPPLTPPPQPSPRPPTGYTRFHGRVVSASTGAALQGVCVVIGSLNCDSDKPHTNELGYWAVDLTTQPYWDFTFQLSGYGDVTTRAYANRQLDVQVDDARLPRQ